MSLIILVAGSIVACHQQTLSENVQEERFISSEDCRVIEHDLGEISICGEPQRVVALGPYVLDNLLALGIQPAGYAEIVQFQRSDFDEPAQQIPFLGDQVTTQPVNVGQSSQPSFDALTQLQPDLIIGGVAGNQDEYNLLSQIAPTLLIDNGPASRWQANILVLAQALQREQQAQEVIANFEQRVAQARRQLAPVIAAHPKILVISGDLKQFFSIANELSYSGRLLSDLGFQLVVPQELQDKEIPTKVSAEVLSQVEPDQILILGINFNIKDFVTQKLGLGIDNFQEKITNHQLANVKQTWQKNAIAQQMKATQQGRVYFSTYYLWNGLRGPIGTQLILDELQQMFLEPLSKL